MSKYYKAEDIDNAIREAHAEAESNEIGGAMFHLHCVVSDLPTIEVSEEVLKATKNFNAYTIADENAEMGMRTQIEPIIEVSEDCISREDLLKHAYKREGVLSASIDSIKLAPSVVPSRAEGEWQITDAYPHNVYCSECHKKFAQTHWAVWEDGSLPRNFCPNCGAKMKGAEE